jgi:hypothetical protein
MSLFRWLCAHLPIAIAHAVAQDEAERAEPLEWITYHQDNFQIIHPPSCDG